MWTSLIPLVPLKSPLASLLAQLWLFHMQKHPHPSHQGPLLGAPSGQLCVSFWGSKNVRTAPAHQTISLLASGAVTIGDQGWMFHVNAWAPPCKQPAAGFGYPMLTEQKLCEETRPLWAQSNTKHNVFLTPLSDQ